MLTAVFYAVTYAVRLGRGDRAGDAGRRVEYDIGMKRLGERSGSERRATLHVERRRICPDRHASSTSRGDTVNADNASSCDCKKGVVHGPNAAAQRNICRSRRDDMGLHVTESLSVRLHCGTASAAIAMLAQRGIISSALRDGLVDSATAPGSRRTVVKLSVSVLGGSSRMIAYRTLQCLGLASSWYVYPTVIKIRACPKWPVSRKKKKKSFSAVLLF